MGPIGERLALDQLHHEVEVFTLHADVVHRADVGMVERGDEPGLALEAGADLRRRGQIGRDLDGDLAAQAEIAGAVNLAHASGAERREDLVGA